MLYVMMKTHFRQNSVDADIASFCNIKCLIKNGGAGSDMTKMARLSINTDGKKRQYICDNDMPRGKQHDEAYVWLACR